MNKARTAAVNAQRDIEGVIDAQERRLGIEQRLKGETVGDIMSGSQDGHMFVLPTGAIGDYFGIPEVRLIEDEVDAFRITYSDALGKLHTETFDSMEDAVETAIGEMFGFANAREELFFGQRQNFTGALYKQVSQGGIENLLHKTEIIQTNVFNGMTLPEMVSQVADGVRAELRSSGIGV